MGTASIWISAISLLIAAVTLGFTIYKYHKHEERLNEQQSAINAYKLKSLEKEELAAKQAEIRGRIVWDSKSSIRLVVYNAGQSNALNVKVEAISSLSGLLTSGFEDIELLNPGNAYDYRAILASGHVKTIKLRYTWSDDSSPSRQYEDYLQID